MRRDASLVSQGAIGYIGPPWASRRDLVVRVGRHRRAGHADLVVDAGGGRRPSCSKECTSMTSTRMNSHLRVRRFSGVKVFSATLLFQRQQLGDAVTQWLAERPALEIDDIVVTQSSDAT